jgi:hypothetical protein
MKRRYLVFVLYAIYFLVLIKNSEYLISLFSVQSNNNLIRVLIFISLFQILLLFYTSIWENFFGGHIGVRSINDPETFFVYFCYFPVISTIPLMLRTNRRLSELQLEMDKQGVTDLKNFKPLPRRSGLLDKFYK